MPGLFSHEWNECSVLFQTITEYGIHVKIVVLLLIIIAF